MPADDTIPIPQLRAGLRGRVLAPGDAEYDGARMVFNGQFDRHPAVIVRVANAQDVARTVELARDTGLELAVRSGGHSGAGHSTTEGGILLDLRDLHGMEIDPDQKTAWADAGLTAGEYSTAAGEHGLATGFGDTGSVGIGGITLGGGIGYLVRKHGLTIDSLLEADIVTADGELLHVDEEDHPDLFWAIRGGGGNLGVATRFRYRLHEVGTIVGGMLILPATPDVIGGFLEEAHAAPEELSTIANVMPAPPMPFIPAELHGRLVLLAFVAYAGEVEAGQRVLAPLRALAEPLADMLRPMPYPEIYPPEQPDYHPIGTGRTNFIDEVSHDAIEMIVERLEAGTAPMRVVQLRALGGAMARVPDDATAFAHRGRRFMVSVAALYERPEDAVVHEPWVTALAADLRGDARGAYVGFLTDEGPDRVREAYPGSTWDRLVQVKRRYDPTNLFRLNQNVPPS